MAQGISKDSMSSHQSQQMTIEDVLRMAVDPCESRHRGNSESVVAHAKVAPSKEVACKRIVAWLSTQGSRGGTSHEIAAALGYGNAINRISGRLTTLKALGWIEKSGEVRNGAAVLQVKL